MTFGRSPKVVALEKDPTEANYEFVYFPHKNLYILRSMTYRGQYFSPLYFGDMTASSRDELLKMAKTWLIEYFTKSEMVTEKLII